MLKHFHICVIRTYKIFIIYMYSHNRESEVNF